MHQEKRCTPLKWELPHASLPVVGRYGAPLVVGAAKRFLCPGCLLSPDQLQSQCGHQRHPGQTDQIQKGMEISAVLHSEKEKGVTLNNKKHLYKAKKTEQRATLKSNFKLLIYLSMNSKNIDDLTEVKLSEDILN